jgi:hypothetical protein
MGYLDRWPKADAIDLTCLLGVYRNRPRCRRAAKQRDELAPFQLIELHPMPLV